MTVQISMGDMVNAYKALVLTPLGDVALERARQDGLWGEQNHPLFHRRHRVLDREYYAEQAHLWQLANATRKGEECLAWDGILLEEVFEALSEEDPAKVREELIQVAAVALAMMESLDRAQALAAE